MGTPAKFIAELSHVREVSLLGTADLGYWQDRLREDDLVPAERDGRAQVLIIAAAARFHGIGFRELSLTVLVSRSGAGAGADASFLLHAYNSNRFFAFCERVLFSTPYSHGDVCVSVTNPISVRLVEHDQPVFRAAMWAEASSPAREPSSRGEAGWEGPVFLPGDSRPGNLFFARIRGYTRTYPFLHSEDILTIEPAPGHEALQALVDSHFVAREWAIRDDALHAKSKTVRRATASAGMPLA